MTYRNGLFLALGVMVLGASSAPAQDVYRKTNDNGRYGHDDDRMYKSDGYYDEDDYYADEDYRGRSGAMNERFRGMDRNRDGRITRREWRGNQESFRRHDRNGDGVLAGREVRANGRRRNGNGRWDRDHDNDYDNRIDALGGRDRNHDGVISRGEWSGSRYDFERLDRNRDGYITSLEARNQY